MQADPPPSRASSLPQWTCAEHMIDGHRQTLWSELAREGAFTSSIHASWSTAFASKLAPTVELR
ncbi:hypothetical protein [Pseudomonas sp. FG-3G]|nr:hypothetical protein [Pseudomonas sp. FG-3G]